MLYLKQINKMNCTITRQSILKAKIASKLKRLRIENNLSQKEVANCLLIDQSHISLIENCRLSPRTENIAMLLEVYKVPLSDFFEDIKF